MDILIDCDDVLADLTLAVRGIIRDIKPELFEGFEGSDPLWDGRNWDYFSYSRIKEISDKIWERMGESGFWSSLEETETARELLNIARGFGRIVICTSLVASDNYVFERMRWLGEHFGIGRHEIVITAEKYLCLGGDVLIDDRPENVIHWSYRKLLNGMTQLPILWTYSGRGRYDYVDRFSDGVILQTGDLGDLEEALGNL